MENKIHVPNHQPYTCLYATYSPVSPGYCGAHRLTQQMPHEDQVRLAPRQFRSERRRGVRQHQDVEVQPDGVQRKLHQSRKDLVQDGGLLTGVSIGKSVVDFNTYRFFNLIKYRV